MSPDRDGLLQRHLPYLKYDSHECYFADSPAEWTDYEANRLQRDNEVLAEAKPHDGTPQLSLDFLGAAYPDGKTAVEGDLIGDTRKDYAAASALLHQRPKYANRIFGRFAEDEARKEKWLQYWFFYFYNDFNLVGSVIGAGRHEGDWEMIQLRLGEGDVPDYAVYAQHKHAGVRHWSQVERLPGGERPVVYVADGWTGPGTGATPSRRRFTCPFSPFTRPSIPTARSVRRCTSSGTSPTCWRPTWSRRAPRPRASSRRRSRAWPRSGRPAPMAASRSTTKSKGPRAPICAASW